MTRTIHLPIMTVSIFTAMVFLMPGIVKADTLSEGHSKVKGVMTADQGGILTVKTPTSNRELNANDPRRMTIVLDQNIAVLEAHPKGQEGRHRWQSWHLEWQYQPNHPRSWEQVLMPGARSPQPATRPFAG